MESKHNPNDPNRPQGFKIITRGHWGCRHFHMPKYFFYKSVPQNVYYVNTFTPMCSEEKECKDAMLTLLEHRAGEMKYLPKYNFVVGGDGNVYEVRGWKYFPSMPRNYRYEQNNCFLLGFTGNHTELTLPDQMFRLAMKFLDYARKRGFIQNNIEVFNIFDKSIVHPKPHQTLSEGDFGYY